MLKKRQKMIKISQIISILMSEKNSVILINKGFSQKYVKVVYPLKQGLKQVSYALIHVFNINGKSSISSKTRIETVLKCQTTYSTNYKNS